MAVDMFLKINGIERELQDSKHKDEIDILACSWGATQSGTTHMGTGGGAGKADVQDLSFTKYVDKSSHLLLMRVLNGQLAKEAALVVRKAGGQLLEYITIKMKELTVTSVSTGGSGGEDRLTENLTLSFSKVEFIYTPQKKGGSPDAEVKTGWDIAANVVA